MTGIQTAGVGVAERGVVAAEEVEAGGKDVSGTVGEGVGGAAGNFADGDEVSEVAIPGDLAEADDDADAREGGDSAARCWEQARISVGAGLSPGGAQRTTEASQHRGGAGRRYGRRSGVSTRGRGSGGRVHEVAGAVAGEGPAGAVSSVGAGGEAEDEDAGSGVAEAGNGPGPVGLVDVGAAAVSPMPWQ